MQLDAAYESDDHPVVRITPGQIGHYGQSASLIVVTITIRPTVLRKPPSGGSQPVAYAACVVSRPPTCDESHADSDLGIHRSVRALPLRQFDLRPNAATAHRNFGPLFNAADLPGNLHVADPPRLDLAPSRIFLVVCDLWHQQRFFLLRPF